MPIGKNWRDTQHQRVEDEIGSFVIGLFDCAGIPRDLREKREREEQQRRLTKKQQPRTQTWFGDTIDVFDDAEEWEAEDDGLPWSFTRPAQCRCRCEAVEVTTVLSHQVG